LNLSRFMRNYFIFIIIGFALFVYFCRNYAAMPKGRRNFHAFVLHLPIFGEAVSDIVHARVCMILAMLIRSGLNFLKAIEIAANVSGNALFETALGDVRIEVQQGKPLSACLAENPLFSPMFVNLTKIGEESGKLPEMIEKAAEYFEARAELFAGRVGVLIEPIVMLLVGGIIGVIGVSMFLPILRISSAVK
jgi:type IV pilus assembly protein PilC